ncbi:hypothetical protein LEM8419_02078 [Neolewinella maritima]|uniref:DUF1304 domain-containing protein n=1 Tax=Neolewinella maritima TaxID=1383882 RepID=A0ABM9B1J0_9BACT|nr:DUF1304 domain-containing protein [Neolewinella maritima]CAH1001172.1 hypothetical protein LEM8419_02078 [Neolewinella maritima]
MGLAAQLLIGLLAVLHLYIMWFEAFAWETRGPKVFPTVPRELFAKTTAQAANQGVYNGFLAAGLIWSLLIDGPWSQHIALFFLSCVAVAGIVGALTVDRKIAYVQTAPALLAIALLLLD